MKKKSKNIDELFREKLNSEEPILPFNKADWDSLEQKLDLAISRKRNIFLLKTLGGIAAVLLLFFALWFVNSDTQSAKKGQETLLTDQSEPKINPNVIQPNDSIKNNLKGQSNNNSLNKPTQEIKTISAKNNKSETSIHINHNPPIYPLLDGIKPIVGLNAPIANKTPTPYPEQFKELQIPPLHKEPSAQPNNQTRKNVTLSILVAPSLNGIGSFKHAEIGNDVGLIVTLDLTKRLSISTGAIYAKKLYESPFNKAIYPSVHGYSKEGYGNGGYNNANNFPESVYADCRVLDIPINLKYTLLDKSKHKVSIGTGVSSYIMLKEKYQFEYPNTSSTSTNDLELTNENQHLMGILNFQASYTRQLNSKIGLSIQPYLKIPMVDVGYSNVKLQSAGVALGIQWNFNASK